ncbi:ribosomal protein S7 domain-containing protein [Morchella snyderi]|nr:ribosomal protein S7 domain-containing protein [Morchella snyderi]
MPPPRTLFLRASTLRIAILPIHHPALLRCYSNKTSPQSTPPKTPATPAQDTLPHVSEEAAATAGITGETKPELEQGTPVQEIINRSAEARKNAPSVLKTPSNKRSYSTEVTPTDAGAGLEAVNILSMSLEEPLPPGAKFPLPTLPIPARGHLQYRYSPLMVQVTNFLMRHGKKATAQSVMDRVLSILRTKPAPKSPATYTPLIPGTPPLSTLPSDPLLYLQTAVDSVAPLMKILSVKGAGGAKDMIPSPLNIRQRRRVALEWIVAAADKKKDRNGLAERFADEIIAVVEGRSAAWDKRNQVHRTAIQSRANVVVDGRRQSTKNTRRFPYN